LAGAGLPAGFGCAVLAATGFAEAGFFAAGALTAAFFAAALAAGFAAGRAADLAAGFLAAVLAGVARLAVVLFTSVSSLQAVIPALAW
jgi:hypothetical protein